MTRRLPRQDRWTVRDGEGLLHAALLTRLFDDEGKFRAYQVSTGCSPVVKQYAVRQWIATDLPPETVHGNFTIVEWRVREQPSCLACLVAPDKL